MATYIISGGSINDTLVKNTISSDKEATIIAADKGMECCIRCEIVPDYLIGDFDSSSKEALAFMEQQEIEIVRLIPEKDDTDTEAALHLAFEKTAGDIVIFGGTGSRLDHVLANIAILGQGLQYHRNVILMDENNRIRLIEKGITIEKEKQYGKYVSVIPIGGTIKGVTLEGFYYPLQDATITTFTSLGVSNEIVDEIGKIVIHEGTALIIESRDNI